MSSGRTRYGCYFGVFLGKIPGCLFIASLCDAVLYTQAKFIGVGECVAI